MTDTTSLQDLLTDGPVEAALRAEIEATPWYRPVRRRRLERALSDVRHLVSRPGIPYVRVSR